MAKALASVRPLRRSDLANCAWAGGPMHLDYVAEALDRAQIGEVDYLAVVHEGEPVAIGGADYLVRPGAVTLWQLVTDPAYRRRGFGTALVRALEKAAHNRDILTARLLVEPDNIAATTLYTRLGYANTGSVQVESWQQVDAVGVMHTHAVQCWEMQRTIES